MNVYGVISTLENRRSSTYPWRCKEIWERVLRRSYSAYFSLSPKNPHLAYDNNFHLVFTDIRPGMKIVNLIVCLSYDQY